MRSVDTNAFSGETRDKRSVLSYCNIFLNRETHHVYRQIAGVRSFRNIVITRKRRNAERFPYADFRILHKGISRSLTRTWANLRGKRPPIGRSEIRQLLRIRRKENACLIHIYFGTDAAKLIDFLKREQAPKIVSFHGADLSEELLDAELTSLSQHCDLLLCRSSSLREVLIDRGCPSDKIRIHRTGVPVPDVSPRNPLRLADGSPLRLLQACRFIEKKGLDTTIQAVAELKKEGNPVTLTLAGDGPERENLERLVNDLGLGKAVQFPGFLTQEELAERYRSHDLFLHPSRITEKGDREGIPNTLLEAMSHGLPPVATMHSGIPEAVTHDKNGVLVDDPAPAAVAAGIRFATDPARYCRLSDAAVKTICERFSVEKAIESLEGLYNEAIAHKGGKP